MLARWVFYRSVNEEQTLQQALAAALGAHFDAGVVRDFGVLCTSAEHAHVVRAIGGLAELDFKRVRIAAQTAFWLNVFNALVVRDIAELAQAETVKEVEAFFEGPRVRVAGFGYSLDDIEHGLLRGNVPKFGAKRPPMERDDPRLAHTPLAYDERMHFGLYSAGRSSPPLRVFDGGRVDQDLEQATLAYVQREARVEQDGALVILPRQFFWYRQDFGGEQSALGFALARLDDAAVDKVDARRGRVKVRYADFDWTLAGA
jgi:hypothetical protein